MSKSRARRFADIISGAEDIPVEALGNVPPNTSLVDNSDRQVLSTTNGYGEFQSYSSETAAYFKGSALDTNITIGGAGQSGEQYVQFTNDNCGTNAWMVGFDDDEIFSIAYKAKGEITSPHAFRIQQDNSTIDSRGRTLAHDGYPVVTTSTTAPASPVDGQFWWDNTTGNVKIYDSTQSDWFLIKSGLDGSSAARAIPSVEEVTSYLGNNFSAGAYWINTPDGGVQQAYLMYAEDSVWVLVGRFAASAADSITGTLNSTRSMIDVSQGGSSMWSADWGSKYVEDIMFWGATDFVAQTGHTVNWVAQINGSQTLRCHLSGATSGDNSTNGQYSLDQRAGAHSSAKHSFYYPYGARDGVFKGSRWVNSGYRYSLVSDAPATCYTNPTGLSSPMSNVSYWHGGQDAKVSVAASGDTSGQDYANSSQFFGYDDNLKSFLDSGTGSSDTNTSIVSYSSAVTVWARFA